MKSPIGLSIILLTALTLSVSAQSYYKESPLFTTAPSDKKSMTPLAQMGPVGLAIELHQPAFTMVVGGVEAGSPAAATGAFNAGQVIDSINGQSLKDIDPRIQLGQIIAAAEAKDGVLKFMVKDNAKATTAKEVIVKLPVLGAYSKTWPLDCPKSDKIIDNFAKYLAQPGSEKGFGGGGMLMLVARGTESDLAVVRDWVHEWAKKDEKTIPWRIGFGGMVVCEYYLKTGDPVAMTVINRLVRDATESEYLDAWSGRGGVVGIGYGRGHLNAGGTQVVTFLMLAKQCGAKISDSLLQRTLTHFFRFAGRGLNPYGDDRPESSFVDNGKNGNLALAMAAAAALTPEGEDSVYAHARDIAAMSAFYTTTYMLHGHTGGGVGEIWRSASMCLLQDKKPAQFRDFLDKRQWHYDMSRKWDGSFSILGGAKYETVEWGSNYPWVYVFPRKSLSITGAAPTKFSHKYQLPKRPWGTAADDVFLSLEAAPDKDGKRMDLSGETLAKDSAKPLIERLQKAGELSDDEIRRYVRHPEFLIRNLAANHAAGMTIAYMFNQSEFRVRPALLEEFARDADPRVRYAGMRAATLAYDPAAEWAKTFFDLAIERLKDADESWFVKDACLTLVGKSTPEMMLPHLELIESFLKHPEQWLQNGALVAMANLAIDERACDRVLPVIGGFISRTQRQSTTTGVLANLRKALPEASPKVQAAARKSLGEMYAGYNVPLQAEGGLDLRGHRTGILERFAEVLLSVPGGAEVLYEVGKKEFPDKLLPHERIFLQADLENVSAELRETLKPIIRDKMIYQFIGANRLKLMSDIQKPASRDGIITNSVDELVSLYQKIGVHDYDWKPFEPDLRDREWDYFSFEPEEKQAYDRSPWRYRKVSLPKGLENWFQPGFDATAAGWKKGLPPFGQYLGKLEDNSKAERNQWNMKPRTFWEHEVLLVRGSFPFPALKPGHMYRVRADRGQGVGAGDGFKLYLNGKELSETKEGLGRRAGDLIRGGWITAEHAEAFAKGTVTLAAITFLRYGERAIVEMPPAPQGIFRVWIEERKLPPLDAETFRKATTMIPMLNSEWQAKQVTTSQKDADPDSDEGKNEEGAEDNPNDQRFRYDGKFIPNPKLEGKWLILATVDSIEGFDPKAKNPRTKTAFNDIELRADGSTPSPNYLWSGDTLMDLSRREALKMQVKSIGGADYLFIEAGGFGPQNPAGWKSPWMVMKRR